MNYSDFTNQTVSEKIGLCILEASERIIGWSAHVGAIYKVEGFTRALISSVSDSGEALSEGASILGLNLGEYFHDRENQVLYLRTTDEVNPNGKFIALTFRLFFSTSNGFVALPYDLDEDAPVGFDVEWVPLIQDTSDFGVDLDNQNQLGFAIEGSGSVKFVNDKNFWGPLYDKVYFENQTCIIFSWTRFLPASEAKILFRGKVQSKTYSDKQVAFSLKDSQNALRAPVDLPVMLGYPNARLSKTLEAARQRRIYGYVFGHRPTNIDAVLTGYPLIGTVDVTSGGTAITGNSTSFLAQISPGDNLFFISPVGTKSYAVKTVTDDSNLVLTSAYVGQSTGAVGYYIKSDNAKRYTNRIFLVGGHATKEPLHTVSQFVSSLNIIVLDSVEDLLPGEDIIVGSENTVIQRIVGNQIKLSVNLTLPATVGTTVRRPSITNVKLDDDLLTVTRDYSYNPTTAVLTLTSTAEFNIAPVLSVSGSSINFSSGSRNVTGGEFFKTEFKPGDWIRSQAHSEYFEIAEILDNGGLNLRTPATYTVTGVALAKKPVYYVEDKTILTCDILGATDDGTTSGVFLKTAPQITEDILSKAGLGDIIDSDSFTFASALAYQKVGLVIPTKYNDKNSPKLKDVINNLNLSVFGSVVQSSDFLLVYHVFRPVREPGITLFDESDIVKFTIKSLSDKIAKNAIVRYLKREYEPISKAAVFSQASRQSNIASFLGKTTNETIIETLLVDPIEAQNMSNRWAFLIGQASTVVTFGTKMQGALLDVTDRVEISHEKLYERAGSPLKRKIAAIQSSRKSFNDVTIETEDLSNAFSRCAVIVQDGRPNYDAATDEERFYDSYVTDTYGMQDNDPETFGINLIW